MTLTLGPGGTFQGMAANAVSVTFTIFGDEMTDIVVTSVDGRTGVVTLTDLYQPLDGDLSAVAALTTTTYGRALLTLANAAGADWLGKSTNLSDLTSASTARTNLGLGTAATQASTAFDAAGAAAAAQAASQPLHPSVLAITSSATPAINTDTYSAVSITALAANITSMTSSLTGTPQNFDKLLIRIKDDGSARTISWGASFESRVSALPVTTVAGKALTVGLIYDSISAKWSCMAVGSAP